MEAFSLFLLWWLFGCRPGGGGAPALPSGMPGGEPGWPGSPISFTPPWPQARPSGLPPFPSGWEFDEPPPAAVQQRARQLVDALWAQGQGAHRIEQTAGRWIAYQAQIVASGRKGVVAYRVKRAALPAAAPQPTLTAARVAPTPRKRPRAPASSSPAPATRYQVELGPAQMKPASTPAVSTTSPESMPVLVRGAGIKPKPPSPNVKLLQQRLGIVDDGQFGAGTEKAVRAYQKKHGLIVDGIVGPDTWSSLLGVRA